MQSETLSLLELTKVPYDEYNNVLPIIKTRLGYAVEVFEMVLAEELPHTTARRAVRTAIKVAMNEEGVYREAEHQKPVFRRKSKKTE